MTTLTTTQAKKNLSSVIHNVSETHTPIQISGKKHSAVLISNEDWQAIQETLYLISLPKMRDSIIEGLQTPVEKCHKELKW